jgi:hypothetical protein
MRRSLQRQTWGEVLNVGEGTSLRQRPLAGGPASGMTRRRIQTRQRSASSPGTCQLFHVKHFHAGGSGADSSAGCLPFMASQTPPAGKRSLTDQPTKVGSEAKAREVTTSKGRSGFPPGHGCHAGWAGAGCGHLLDEGGFLGHRVDTAHCHLRAANGNHHTRQTGARADIEQAALHCRLANAACACRRNGPPPPGCPADGGSASPRVAHGGQVVDLGPFLHQVQVGQQAATWASLRSRPSASPRAQRLIQFMHQAATAAILSGAPSAAHWQANPRTRFFLRWTSSSEMVAGVMPEMREARPRVSGRCLASFWRASKLRP